MSTTNTYKSYWVDIEQEVESGGTYEDGSKGYRMVKTRYYLRPKDGCYRWFMDLCPYPAVEHSDIGTSLSILLEKCKGMAKGNKDKVKIVNHSKALQLT